MNHVLLLLLILACGTVNGNYFRYGSIDWRRVNATVNPSEFVIEYTVKIAANDVDNNLKLGDYYTFYGNVFEFGDGTNTSFNETIVRYHLDGWFVIVAEFTHTYSGPGPWFAQILSTEYARDGALVNNDLKRARLRAQVDVTGISGDTGSPVIEMPFSISFHASESWKFTAFDPDGDTVTYRLSTAFELGDPLNAASLGINAQLQEQPYLIQLSSDGVITWPSALQRIPGTWQMQVMVSDGRGAEVPVDFFVINRHYTAPRPVVEPVTAVENFLVSQPIQFSIRACDDVGIYSVNTTEDPGVVAHVGAQMADSPNGTKSCVRQLFEYTPTEAGILRQCFYAWSTNQSNSDVLCIYHNVSARPHVYTTWQVASRQVTGHPVSAWFTGFFLHPTDRIMAIPVADNCSDLADNAGQEVSWAGMPVARVGTAPTVNLQESNTTIITGPVGQYKWCYKLNAGTPYGVVVDWYEPPNLPWRFYVDATGPYQIETLVSCPVSDKAFEYIVHGIDLQRFDRVAFHVPSQPVPYIPTSPLPNLCEDLSPSAGQQIKDFPTVDTIGPGYVIGAEEAHFAWKHVPSDYGIYICYRPTSGEWRLLDYVRTPFPTGIYRTGNPQAVGATAMDLTLYGVGDLSGDRWAVVPPGSECTWSANWTVVAPGTVSNTQIQVDAEIVPGINRLTLCYVHNNELCTIGEIDARDTAYNCPGIQDALSTTPQYNWADYEPFTAYVNQSMPYEFTGYAPYGYNVNDACIPTGGTECNPATCAGMEVKVAEHSSCNGYAKGGEPQIMTPGRHVVFRLEEPGLFRFCVKHRLCWEPVARGVNIIAAPNLTAPPEAAYWGASHCNDYMQQWPELGMCGCYLDGGEAWGAPVDTPTDFLVDTALSRQLNFNQGCCDIPSAARMEHGTTTLDNGYILKWGYCTHTAIVIPLPYPDFAATVVDPNKI